MPRHPSISPIDCLCGALDSPERRAILRTLLQHPQTVNALAKQLHVSQSMTSIHLTWLNRAGLVTYEQDGHYRWYSCANPEFVQALFALFEQHLALAISKQAVKREVTR